MAGDKDIDWDGLGEQYDLVYRTALRAIEGQEANLDSLRSRVGQLIAAAAVATSFLGGLALADADGGFGWLTWAALVLFAGAVGIGLWMIYPTGDWHFRSQASKVLSGYMERQDEPASIAELCRGLAVDMEEAHEKNAPMLERRFLAFQAAVLLVALEVMAWLVELGLRADT